MIKQIIEDEEGVSFADVLAAIVILLSLTAIMLTSTRFINQTRANTRKITTFNEVVQNVVMDTYVTDEWDSLTDRAVPALGGDVEVDYTYHGITDEYQTHHLSIEFTRESVTETHTLERSVVHDETDE